MITAAAQAMSNQLHMQVWLSNANELLSELQIILQTLPEGILLLRRDGVVSQMNAPAGTMLGLTPAKVTGRRLRDVLPLPSLLLQGETGTGKEIFAQSIHSGSARADGPFVAINCAAIPRELINTELFGYEGGSFTGADRQGRAGKFEQAHGGTLFLDEIGDMPLDLQTTLLRAIETRTIVRIGGHRVISADVRIIVATHKDLREEARRGSFRADLFYRLNVLTIHLPPLRDRLDDVSLLVEHFWQRPSRILS